MRILGIIPSRYGSSRFPGKPLIDLKGKSMIQRVFDGASASKLITDLVVATDDERIFDHVLAVGGKAIMTDVSHASGTDRCAEVVRKMEDEYDVVINIQGDEPLINATQLDLLLAVFSDETIQIATIASKKITTEELNNPNRIKVVTDYQNNALYFSRSAIPNSVNGSEQSRANYPYLRHIGLYAFRPMVLETVSKLKATELEQIESLEQLRWMYYGYRIHVVETDIETPNIDVPEDVAEVLEMIS